jgi:hypothetical protein
MISLNDFSFESGHCFDDKPCDIYCHAIYVSKIIFYLSSHLTPYGLEALTKSDENCVMANDIIL